MKIEVEDADLIHLLEIALMDSDPWDKSRNEGLGATVRRNLQLLLDHKRITPDTKFGLASLRAWAIIDSLEDYE